MAFDDSDNDIRVTAAESIVERILVIDEQQNAVAVRAALERFGFRVDVASDPGQARALARTHTPDFVILELVLPGETGFELCAFFKTRNDSLPVLVLTEVDFDAARNLAIWCGADGYLTKPVGEDSLYRVVAEVTETVWRRTHLSSFGTQGSIQFACTCGKSLSVGQANAGKAVICPRCKSLVISPKHCANVQGVWKGGVQQRLNQSKQAGFFCRRCGQMIELLANRRSNRGRCGYCREPFQIPEWVAERRHLFFQQREASPAEDRLLRFDPLSLVTVQCNECRTSYRLSSTSDPSLAARCPHCEAEQTTLSVKGSPLSRAALKSTGRLFSFIAGPLRRRSFLLPETGELIIGSDPRCHITVADAGLSPRHCVLRMTAEGPAVRDLESEIGTIVNDHRIRREFYLQPGDIVAIGKLKLTLMSAGDVDEADVLDQSLKTRRSGAEETFVGQAKVAGPAAKILQIHWERVKTARGGSSASPFEQAGAPRNS